MPKSVVVPTARPERTVFLALPQGTDVSEPALRVRVELQAAKLAISAPPTTPATEAEARAALREVLGRADAAVHIVGRSAGALLRDGQVPAAHLQLEESGRWVGERPGFRRYILLLVTHKEGNAAHQAFVGRLQQDLAEGGLLRPDDHLNHRAAGRDDRAGVHPDHPGRTDIVMLCSPEQPYPGLRPFELEEAEYFCGRKQEIRRLEGIV